MIVVLQRVTQAKVDIDEKTVGQIGKGLMVLVCAEKGDTDEKVFWRKGCCGIAFSRMKTAR